MRESPGLRRTGAGNGAPKAPHLTPGGPGAGAATRSERQRGRLGGGPGARTQAMGAQKFDPQYRGGSGPVPGGCPDPQGPSARPLASGTYPRRLNPPPDESGGPFLPRPQV